MAASNSQWIRKLSLVAADQNGRGIDLGNFRVRFEVRRGDTESPNTLVATIYNLSAQTSNKVGGEYSNITLQAGYENGSYGTLFVGNVKWTERGKENSTDTFLRIGAGDGDEAYNFSVCNTTLAAGASAQDIMNAMTNAFVKQGVDKAEDLDKFVGVIPPETLARGKVLFGMARSHMRDWAQKNGFRWSIQNEKLVLVPVRGYRQREAVVISSTTGMIGIPTANQNGVSVRCLMNPLIEVGCLIKIEQGDINTLTVQQQGFRYQGLNVSAPTTKEGFYRVLVAEHTGDTRGQEWYTDITCLAVDISATASESVAVPG
ncbi:hypothetical protein OVY01_13490 [Robbsia sp. Bb-Pol-6]|uniref:Bacteriophage protein n=1 Tax=Robbsia betulipollinis TaxID=2981849 RepID=A0ABT3ZPN4_9BURK|nr:hypothetical protein [Robbsia betulipollinis]MCY0388232.1 hypothetical protein [Robbsia betulipollinis]